MQMQLAQVLEVTTSTAGLLQKLVSKDGSPFEANLRSALKTDEKGAASLTEKILKKLGSSKTDTEQLAATGAGALLLQCLMNLNQAGLNETDLKHLLTGEGSKVSDTGLKSLLATLGYKDEQISAIMSDTGRKEKLTTALSGKLDEMLKQYASATGKDVATLKIQLTNSLDGLKEQASQLTADLQDLGIDTKTIAGDQLAEISRSVTEAVDETPASAPQLAMLLQSMTTGTTNISATSALPNRKELNAKAEKLIETATEDIGVETDQLAKVLTATDPQERAAAVSAVTEKVNAYLEKHQGENLTPEVKASLQFIKAGMSEKEFAGIDDALQVFHGVSFKTVATPVGSHIMQAAAQQLAPQTDHEQAFNNVLDQFRQSFASELKTPPSSVSLELNPPMLGRVDVNVSLVDGNLSASFKADQVVTRDMLTNNIENLKETLREQGFNVNQVNVSLDFGRERRDDLAFAFAQQQRRDSQSASRNASREQGRVGVEAVAPYTFSPSVSYTPGQLSLFA